jgi:hypothetical protein
MDDGRVWLGSLDLKDGVSGMRSGVLQEAVYNSVSEVEKILNEQAWQTAGAEWNFFEEDCETPEEYAARVKQEQDDLFWG